MVETAIREAMGRHHVSLSRLARDAHVERATIYSWFHGSRPEPETWARVSARLELAAYDVVLGRSNAAQTPDPVVSAIEHNTHVLEAILATLRSGAIPTDPAAAARVAEVIVHGNAVAVPRAKAAHRRERNTRPPRTPDPGDLAADTPPARRRGGLAG